MKTSLHKIYTPDKTLLHGLIYEPETPTKKVLAHVHGMGGSFYENFFLQPIAEKLTNVGVSFSPFNNRGNGLITTLIRDLEDKVEYIEGGTYVEKFENCVEDIKAHIDYLEAQGYEEIHLSGHSLGAPKIVYYMNNTNDPRIKSMLLLSPSDMLGLVRGEGMNFEEWIAIAKQMVKENKGNELMPEKIWGEYPVTPNTFINIFDDGSEAAIFNFLNPSDGFEMLGNIRIPVMAVMGTKDDALTIGIEETMETIKKEAKSAPNCETYIIKDAPHSYYGHEEELAEVVADWIKQ